MYLERPEGETLAFPEQGKQRSGSATV